MPFDTCHTPVSLCFKKVKPLSIGRGLVRRMNEGPVALTLKSSYLLVTSKEKTHAIHDADVAQGV